jgi:hypothetical protein
MSASFAIPVPGIRFDFAVLTSSQVLPPYLPEPFSPEKHDQIAYDEQQTHRALAALETIARRSSPVNQQPYVELRDLLETISSDEAETNQAIWLYALLALSIVLPLIVLTLRYWQRPVR